MGKIFDRVQADTQEGLKGALAKPAVQNTLNGLAATGSAIADVANIAGRTVLLTLSTAWIGLGPVNAVKNMLKDVQPSDAELQSRLYRHGDKSETPTASRFDTSKMYAVKFGNYFLPLSQTYTLQASKRLNVSSLVDGVDIIQQTRKEAKTIDCTLKISVNEAQEALQVVTQDEENRNTVVKLGDMLNKLYESDMVFLVDNETINDTFGIEYVIMSKYRFMPRAGSKTFIFEFSLMEVKFGDDILTFDEKQIQAPDTNDSLIA